MLRQSRRHKLTDISCSAVLSIHGNFGQRLIEYTASGCSACERDKFNSFMCRFWFVVVVDGVASIDPSVCVQSVRGKVSHFVLTQC